jgi:hypothetical protein
MAPIAAITARRLNQARTVSVKNNLTEPFVNEPSSVRYNGFDFISFVLYYGFSGAQVFTTS